MTHDTHDSHDTTPPTPSTPTLGGTPSWIKWVAAAGVLVLLFLAFMIIKSSNSNTDSKNESTSTELNSQNEGKFITISPLETTDRIKVPYGSDYHIEDGDYDYEDNLTDGALDGASDNIRSNHVKWFTLRNRTDSILKVRVIWKKKF